MYLSTYAYSDIATHADQESCSSKNSAAAQYFAHELQYRFIFHFLSPEQKFVKSHSATFLLQSSGVPFLTNK